MYFDDLTGLAVTWDLDQLKLIDYDSTKSTNRPPLGFSYLNRSSELVSLRIGLEINPGTFAGLELGGSMDDYQNQPNYKFGTNDVQVFVFGPTNGVEILPTAQNQPVGQFVGNQRSVNFGPYIQGTLSKHMQVECLRGLYGPFLPGKARLTPIQAKSCLMIALKAQTE